MSLPKFACIVPSVPLRCTVPNTCSKILLCSVGDFLHVLDCSTCFKHFTSSENYAQYVRGKDLSMEPIGSCAESTRSNYEECMPKCMVTQRLSKRPDLPIFAKAILEAVLRAVILKFEAVRVGFC